MGHTVGGKQSLKISALQLRRFGIYDVLKIERKRMTDQPTQSIIYEAVYRTAPATPGLLKTRGKGNYPPLLLYL